MEFWLFMGGGVFLYYVVKALVTPSSQPVPKANRSNSESGIRVTMTTSNRVVANSNRDDDDLATFNISYGYSEEKSRNKTPGKWIKSGEPITIKGQQFFNGNFYFGGKLSSCIFCPIPITDSGSIRSSILEVFDHQFWFYPITFSGFPESMIG